jgi:hypothetical protein
LIVVKEIEDFGGRRGLSAEDKELKHGRDRVSNQKERGDPTAEAQNVPVVGGACLADSGLIAVNISMDTSRIVSSSVRGVG